MELTIRTKYEYEFRDNVNNNSLHYSLLLSRDSYIGLL